MKFLERFWHGCSHCHNGEGCPLADNFEPDGASKHEYGQGATLVLAVVLVFILPLAAAIAGAAIASHYGSATTSSGRDWLQVGGATVGFFVGVVMARVVFWIRRRCTPAKEGAE